MECVGAVIALNDKAQNLDDKIICIERILVDPLNGKKLSFDNSQISFSKSINSSNKQAKSQHKNYLVNFFKTRLFKIIISICLLTRALA